MGDFGLLGWLMPRAGRLQGKRKEKVVSVKWLAKNLAPRHKINYNRDLVPWRYQDVAYVEPPHDLDVTNRTTTGTTSRRRPRSGFFHPKGVMHWGENNSTEPSFRVHACGHSQARVSRRGLCPGLRAWCS